jgi:hypothetical protein
VRRAGLITATSGFNSSETSLAAKGEADGNVGKLVLLSSSPKLPLTIAGKGTNATASTAPMDVRIPLIISSVERNDSHAIRVLGGNPRIATRRTTVNRHNTGSSNTRGLIANRAHSGIGGGSFVSKRLGRSGEEGITSEISLGPITIFSIKPAIDTRLDSGTLFNGPLQITTTRPYQSPRLAS